MADDIVLINVPGPGDPSAVEVFEPTDGVVVVPNPSVDLGPITTRVDALEDSDTDQNIRILALEFGGGTVPSLAYTHEQSLLSSVWLITHGLPFQPAGIDVVDHLGNPHHPIVTWPDASTVQLTFGYDVRGVARLS